MKFGDIHEINSVLQQIQNEEKTKVVESCGCGCGTKEECTCGPECSSCDCHSVSEAADKNRAIRIDKIMRANQMDTLADLLADTMHFAEITGADFGMELDRAKGYYEDADQQESVKEVAQHGTTEYYRELDKGQLNHTHSILMKTISQLEVAINQRSKFGKELMGNGDRAGTGHLQNMLDKLKVISSEWEEESKLYGN
jgi:hypothetical protein